MKINIKTINLELTPAIEDYIEKKINSLEKFIQRIKVRPLEIWVEVDKTTAHHKKGDIFKITAQFTFPQKTARAEATRSDIYLAIDEVKDELQRKFKQYTDKHISQQRRGGRKLKKLFNLSIASRFFRKGRIREEGM